MTFFRVQRNPAGRVGREETARTPPQPVFDKFEKGSDTADVKAALLATLGQSFGTEEVSG